MDRIEWTCDICGRPIEDQMGSLWADIDEANHVVEERAEWTRNHEDPPGSGVVVSSSEIFSHPRSARWHCTHDECLDPGGVNSYEVDVKRIRTPWAVVDWTSHLLEKPWVAHGTNWAAFIGSVAREHGSEADTAP